MPDPDAQPIVSAFGLGKEFRDFWNRPKAKALIDVDLDVFQGESIGLLGPNGSGKSTMVKMILGLLYPTAGVLKVFGKSPREVENKKRIGYLPEETYLYQYLTAFETLDFFGALFNLSKSDRRSRAEQLLEMVGLEHARKRPVGEFSKGMARRIGLAQAMINDPDLLILDEPTSGLDPIGCREVKDLIQLLKRRGKTVLITSHLLGDVEDVCDRVVILYGGRIRATGTLNELLTVPDESRITSPLMSPEVTEKVLRLLRENFKKEEFVLDHPRKNLERFFLDVINQAKEESVETAGVVSGGRVADYLRGDAEAGKVSLEELTKSEPPPPEEESAESEPEPAGDVEKLEELERDETTASGEEEPPDEQAKVEKESLSEANEKLRGLLGGDDDSKP